MTKRKGLPLPPQGKDKTPKGEKPKESSSGPQKSPQEGGGSQGSSQTKKGYKGNKYDPTKAWCRLCSKVGHPTGDNSCPKKSPSSPAPTGIASMQLGIIEGFNQVRVPAEATLISEGGVEIVALTDWPANTGKYGQTPLINGVVAKALRDTGASVTMVTDKLVSPD